MHDAVEILLVEDNEFDVEALKRAFRKAEIGNPLHNAVDGIDALDKLQGPIRQPLLILLDINMPRMDGFEFLDMLRNDDKYKHSVVFMLTTSDYDRDRQMAYSRHVAGYFLKENLQDLVDTVKAYVRGNEFPQAGAARNSISQEFQPVPAQRVAEESQAFFSRRRITTSTWATSMPSGACGRLLMTMFDVGISSTSLRPSMKKW